MSEILEVINKYKNRLLKEPGLVGDMFFYENGSLNIDKNLYDAFHKKMNKLALENYNFDLQFETKELFLGFLSVGIVDEDHYDFCFINDLGIFTIYYDPPFEEFEAEYVLEIIYWDDISSIDLEYVNEHHTRINFDIKNGENNDSFYKLLIEFGKFGSHFNAQNYQACKLVVELLNDIIEVLNKNVCNEKIEELNVLLEEEQYDELLIELESIDRDDLENVYTYHFLRMEAFHGLGENLKTLEEANEYRRFLDRNDKSHDFQLGNLYSLAYKYNEDGLNSIKWFNETLQLYTKANRNVEVDVIEELQSELENSYEVLKKEFVDISFQKRKFIFMSDELLYSEMEGLVVLKVNDIPENIKFPLSHPQLNEVYTFHPNNANSYIPLKDYQKELFVDKLREFLILLDTLGATKIDIINKNRNIDKNENSSEKKIGVKASYKVVSTNVDYNNKENNNNQLERELNLAFHQKLSPKKAPYIPEGLVWLPTDLNWQRMAEQRMNGSLMSHREIITSKQIESLSSHELTKVNVELNVLLAKANVDYQKDDISKSSSENHFELEIQVEFEDIDNLKQVHNNLNNNERSNNNLDKYKEDVLFMLEDDGIIDEIERKLLNRKIEKYGISIDEAEQVEKELMFNNDELKYLEEYKLLLLEGEIGEIEQKMLLRYAKRYNISEERQKVLNNSFK
ncbi:hypothetical protein KO494_12505 [Lacinutrix sp. C3R15]|uniref:hypothetical protein n=1 Tax=Flavobacteriaceae TaxID=49546 RepID=UPI001C084399|nr:MULTISPECIES: hypothetical protein [Flavobacteriaceae]MBU2940359.1 hypothetical protein [Lacinutrix sp. C3R15]MDO6623679.1 hypothetical protein [Oceanihabitans sp. 1_MG-2023]